MRELSWLYQKCPTMPLLYLHVTIVSKNDNSSRLKKCAKKICITNVKIINFAGACRFVLLRRFIFKCYLIYHTVVLHLLCRHLFLVKKKCHQVPVAACDLTLTLYELIMYSDFVYKNWKSILSIFVVFHNLIYFIHMYCHKTPARNACFTLIKLQNNTIQKTYMFN